MRKLLTLGIAFLLLTSTFLISALTFVSQVEAQDKYVRAWKENDVIYLENDAAVGVKPGDWAEYTLSFTFETNNPDMTLKEFWKREFEPLSGVIEVSRIKVKVERIVRTNVRIHITLRLHDGREVGETHEISVASITGSSGILLPSGGPAILFIIAKDLSKDDTIGGWPPWRINATVLQVYGGVEREVNWLSFKGEVQSKSKEYVYNQQVYYDRSSGILCEWLFNLTVKDRGYTTTSTFQLILAETNIWSTVKEMPITLERHSYQDGIPDDLFLLLEFLGIKDRALAGRFYAEFKPIERVTQVEMELKLGYVTVDEFKGWTPPTRWEIRKFEMKRTDSGFATTFDISTYWPLNAIYVIGGFLYGGVEGFPAEVAKKAFLGSFLPKIRPSLIGDEPIYLTAEITKITVIDVNGNSFEFPIREKIKTATEKWFERLLAEQFMYGMVYSPVALSVVDPEGKRVGTFQGKSYDEIKSAFYSGTDWPIQLILISNPKQGEYKIEVEGLESGEYSLYAGFVDNGKVLLALREKEPIEKGAIATFTLSSPGRTPVPMIWLPIFLVTATIVTVILSVYMFMRRQKKSSKFENLKPFRSAR